MKYIILSSLYFFLIAVSVTPYYFLLPDTFLLEIKSQESLYEKIKMIESIFLISLAISFPFFASFFNLKLLRYFKCEFGAKYFWLHERAIWLMTYEALIVLMIAVCAYFLHPSYDLYNSPTDGIMILMLPVILYYLIFLMYLKYHLNKKFSPCISWMILLLLAIVCFYPFLFLMVWIFGVFF